MERTSRPVNLTLMSILTLAHIEKEIASAQS